MAATIPGGVILLSGTNGKTTTARLIRAALDASGRRVVANTAGSNLERGVATALLDAESPDVALFEADEAALPALVEQTRPIVVVLMNLFRDQLDRYGELESLARRWALLVAGLDPATTLVYNADDPALAEICRGHPAAVAYGVDDPRVGRKQLPHAADSTACRRCGNPLRYRLMTIAHLGHWECPSCGAHRPDPAVRAASVEFDGMAGQRITIAAFGSTPAAPAPETDRGARTRLIHPAADAQSAEPEATPQTGEPEGTTQRADVAEVALRLPGLPNTYNAVAAAAVCGALGLGAETIAKGLDSRAGAFGRAEHVRVGDRRVTTLLAKNPAGANENIRMVLDESPPLHLLVLLNDRTADGRDVSWIWDVDYESLVADNLPASLTLGGTRAHDLALRFRYAGHDAARMSVVPEPAAAFDTALDAAGPGGRLYVLPTYTAMLDLRRVLADRGLVPEFWEDR